MLVWAAAAGAATMTVELSAVRLVAPWFGTSSGVWTNVIGVILLALAIGYLGGAKLAGQTDPRRWLSRVLFAAALWTLALPLLVEPVCSLFMPDGLRLDQALPLFLWGSLAATLLLFLVPAVLLGCVGPLAVECVALGQRVRAGTAGGRVLAVSTLGSLVGTFATTHVLVPRLGLSWTMLSAGAVLALGATVLRFGRGTAAGGALAVALAFAGSRVNLPGVPEGASVLERRESPYQSLRVVDRPDWGMRFLQVNEGLDSFQSVWAAEPGPLGEGFYYDAFALPLVWSQPVEQFSSCVLGLGAGTAFRVLEGVRGETELDLVGVELDPAVVELGERWFDLPQDAPNRRVLAGVDARVALRALGKFDLIVLDAYAHQVEIPPHLATVEFFEQVYEHLEPGGWFAINVGGFGFDDPVVSAIAATAAEAFDQPSLVLRVLKARNFAVFNRREAALPEPGTSGFRGAGPLAARVAPLELAHGTRWIDAGDGLRLDDDWNPLDRLQRESLRRAEERWRAR